MMKKAMKKILVLLLVTAFVLPCASSCATKKPERFWARTNLSMGLLKSYEQIDEVEFTYFVEKDPVNVTVKSNVINITEKDGLYYYSSSESRSVSEPLGLDSVSISMFAYHDGKMFLSDSSEDFERRLVSDNTEEEFYEYFDSIATEINYFDCSNANIQKNEDKTYTVTCSGYSEEQLKAFSELLGFDIEESCGAPAVDVNFSAQMNKKHRIESIQYDYVFGEVDTEIKPKISVKRTYKNFNSAEKITDTLDVADYKSVSDVRMASQISDMIDGLYERRSGNIEMIQRNTVNVGSDKNSEYLKIEALYGENEGGFFYEISESGDNTSSRSEKYYNGVRSTNQNPIGKEMGEDKARKKITNIFDNYLVFLDSYVTDMEKDAGGVYKFYIHEYPSSAEYYKQFFEGYNGEYLGSVVEMSFTVEDGRIVKYVYEDKVEGTILAGSKTQDVTIKNTITITVSESGSSSNGNLEEISAL